MARTATSETLWTHVYEALRAEILNGVHQPGARLKPSELRGRFGVSVSVLREALSRLAEQRLVTAQHNQGFRVIDLTEKGLRELTDIRVLVEGYALRQSIKKGDVAWESSVVAAHHLLTRTPTRSPENPTLTTEAWSQAHRQFHFALIDACDMPMLLDLCSALFDASELYRRLSAPPADEARRDVAREHREICEAAVARDEGLAVMRLADHLERTTELVMRRMAAGRLAPAAHLETQRRS